MKIIKSYKDIYEKIYDGIDYCEYRTMRNTVCRQAKQHPFDAIKVKDQIFFLLLKQLRKEYKVTIIDYYISVLITHLYKFIVSISGLLSSRFIHWEFCETGEIKKNSYEYITCTKGINRAMTYYLNKDCIYDVPVIKKYDNLKVLDRLRVILIMFSKRHFSYWHVAQFYSLKKTKPKIVAEKIMMEEGGDYVGRCFVFLFKDDVKETVLTVSTPYTNGLTERFFYGEIITNNFVSKKQLSLVNDNVTVKAFPPNIEIKKYNINNHKNCIGYAPDKGNPILTMKKKSQMDGCFLTCAVKNSYGVEVSIHPQDSVDLYQEIIDGNNIIIRNERSLEGFLSGIDVLVTWWGSMIFQAIYCGVPVIIIDLFSDGHGDELSAIVPGFLKIAKNESELDYVIKYFKSISLDKRHTLHIEAVNKLFAFNT